MRFCPFCLSLEVPPRRRYCCDAHRKAAQRQRASEAGKLRYALAACRRRSVEREQHRYRWRQIAMGFDTDANLAVVFRPKRRRRGVAA